MSIYEASITNPKKQLEFYKDLSEQLQQENEMLHHYKTLYQSLKRQKEELRSWLEKEIYLIEPKGTGINYNCEYDSEEDYISAMKEQSKLNTLKEVLSKLEELEGVKDE